MCVEIKGEWTNIFNENKQIHTKELIRITQILTIILLVLFIVIFIKYDSLFQVSINGEVIGYVKNKNELETKINEYIESKEEGVAFRNLEVKTEYTPAIMSNKTSNDEEVLEKIKENISTTYTAYGITIDDDIKTYVGTEEEADKIVSDLQNEYKDKLVLNIGVKQIFGKEKIDTVEETVAVSKLKTENIDVKVAQIEEETKKAEESKKTEKSSSQKTTNNKVVVAVRPISGGKITSRFGERSSVRSSAHTGLDLAAPTGTAIKAAASGKVTLSGYKGSYGYMIKIECDNGYEMWYAHCSKLYVNAGVRVSAGDKIAAVGSTGNSTGSHLHFEIRKNGKALNPQNYI